MKKDLLTGLLQDAPNRVGQRRHCRAHMGLSFDLFGSRAGLLEHSGNGLHVNAPAENKYVLLTYVLIQRAPTSGGQYHWVSELAPRSCQKYLSYLNGRPTAKMRHVTFIH